MQPGVTDQRANAIATVADPAPPEAIPQSEVATLVRWIAWAAIAFGGTGAMWGLIYLPRVMVAAPRYALPGLPRALRWVELGIAMADTIAAIGLVWTGILCLRGAGPLAVRWLGWAALVAVLLAWLLVPTRLVELFSQSGRYGRGWDTDLAGIAVSYLTNTLTGTLVPVCLWWIARDASCARLLSRGLA